MGEKSQMAEVPLPDQSACPYFLPPPAIARSQLPPSINQQQSQDRQNGSLDHYELALHTERYSSDLRQLQTLDRSAQDAQTETWYIAL